MLPLGLTYVLRAVHWDACSPSGGMGRKGSSADLTLVYLSENNGSATRRLVSAGSSTASLG
jgi:hypothetical protein